MDFKKIKSATKKIANLDLLAYTEGKSNFKKGLKQEEAEARANMCVGCNSIEDEPIEELQYADPSIPHISNKMCSECGCAIALKIRQDISKCPLKKW